MIIINYDMFTILRLAFYILSITFFVSCGFDNVDIVKNENDISFYRSGKMTKQYILNAQHQIIDIYVYDDGILSTKWLADDMELIDTVEYYGNGNIKTKGYMLNGNKHSLWTYYDRKGHLLIERYFSYGKPSNVWIWYDHYDNSIQKYEIYSDIRDNGEITRFYRSGGIKEKKNYTANKLNGAYFLYNIKQELIDSFNYKMGKKTIE